SDVGGACGDVADGSRRARSAVDDPRVEEDPEQHGAKHDDSADDDGHDPQRAARAGSAVHASPPRGVSGGSASSPRTHGSPSGSPATSPASTSMQVRRWVM